VRFCCRGDPSKLLFLHRTYVCLTILTPLNESVLIILSCNWPPRSINFCSERLLSFRLFRTFRIIWDHDATLNIFPTLKVEKTEEKRSCTQSWIYGLVRGLEDIEWRVMERISRAREARETVRGERGWVESRDRTTSVRTRTRVRIIDVVLQAPWWPIVLFWSNLIVMSNGSFPDCPVSLRYCLNLTMHSISDNFQVLLLH